MSFTHNFSRIILGRKQQLIINVNMYIVNVSMSENDGLCMLSCLLQACNGCNGDCWLEIDDSVPSPPYSRGIQSTGHATDTPHWPTSQTCQTELKAAVTSPIGHHHVMIREARIQVQVLHSRLDINWTDRQLPCVEINELSDWCCAVECTMQTFFMWLCLAAVAVGKQCSYPLPCCRVSFVIIIIISCVFNHQSCIADLLVAREKLCFRCSLLIQIISFCL